MPEPSRFPPDDPREWLNRARSDLTIAKKRSQGIYLEDLCFHAQQAAEKAIKAVLILWNVEFPYIHDLARLMEVGVQAGVTVPEEVLKAAVLTRFAVLNRYPGTGRVPSDRDYQKALHLAQTVVVWAERLVKEARGE